MRRPPSGDQPQNDAEHGSLGIYAVLAHHVALNKREIGVRMALGAQIHDVITLIVGEGLSPVLVGGALGCFGAWAVTRVLASQLFGVTATDPATFVIVVLLLVSVAGLACWLPARWAARTDPMAALRCD